MSGNEVGNGHKAIQYVIGMGAALLSIMAVKSLRSKGWKLAKKTSMVLLALGSLGCAPVSAGDVTTMGPASSQGAETYEQMFKRMQGKLVVLTDDEGNLTPQITQLLLLRPHSTNYSESDLKPIPRPINRYAFGAKYPFVGKNKSFYPLLSLYDSTTVQQATRCLGTEMGWVIAAEAMRESVRVAGRIENLLSGTKFSLVALRPLDYYAKDGARIGAIFTKQTEKSSVPEVFVYFLDPEKIGNPPEMPPSAKYIYGARDRNYYKDTRVCDHQTAEFIRAVHREVESAAAQMSEISESR